MRTLESWRKRIQAVAHEHSPEAVQEALGIIARFSGGQNTAAARSDLALEYQRRACPPEAWEVIDAADA